MSPSSGDAAGLSVHRIDALTDGIYAVAMTLLVIELKLTEPLPLHDAWALLAALAGLLPKFYAWTISFGVMALFWMGHHRVHGGLRHVDRRLVVLNMGQLAFVSLMPFSCALLGEHPGVVAQTVFAGNMAVLAAFALATLRHVRGHPALCHAPLSTGAYRSARVRLLGLIALCGATVAIEASLPTRWGGTGNMAFMLIAIVGRLSRRIERPDSGSIQSRG